MLQKLFAPKRVQLPDGRLLLLFFFFARYQKVGRHVVNPTCVRIARINFRKIEPRRQRARRIGPGNQRRRRRRAIRGLDISTAMDLVRRETSSKLGKMIINVAIDYIPTDYKNIKNKIRNKKVKSVLNTGIDDYIVNRGVDLIGERFN